MFVSQPLPVSLSLYDNLVFSFVLCMAPFLSSPRSLLKWPESVILDISFSAIHIQLAIKIFSILFHFSLPSLPILSSPNVSSLAIWHFYVLFLYPSLTCIFICCFTYLCIQQKLSRPTYYVLGFKNSILSKKQI